MFRTKLERASDVFNVGRYLDVDRAHAGGLEVRVAPLHLRQRDDPQFDHLSHLTLRPASVVDSATASPPRHAGWEATLALGFERVGAPHASSRGASTADRSSCRSRCIPKVRTSASASIVHPPGGHRRRRSPRADRRGRPRARAQLTTPGATQVVSHRRVRRRSQHSHATVADGARSNGCRRARSSTMAPVRASTTRIDLPPGAAFIGMEIVSLGRTAAGERFGAASGASASKSCATAHRSGASVRVLTGSGACSTRGRA